MRYRFLGLVLCIFLLGNCSRGTIEKPVTDSEDSKNIVEEKQEKSAPYPTFNCSLEKYSLDLFGNESPCYFTVSRTGEEAGTFKLENQWNRDSTIELAKLVGSDDVFVILQEHREDNHYVCKFFKCDDNLKEVFTLDNGYSPLHFESDGDSDRKIVQAYDWWDKESGARALAPQVVLVWKDNQLKLDKKRMKEMMPSSDQLESSRNEFRKEASNKKNSWPNLEFEEFLVSLIYSGNERKAKKMLNYCWPVSRSGKEKFWSGLQRKLKGSPYYEQVRELNRA